MTITSTELKNMRKALKLTLREAEALTGIPASSIWSMEKSIYDTGAKKIARLEKAYQDELKRREDEAE